MICYCSGYIVLVSAHFQRIHKLKASSPSVDDKEIFGTAASVQEWQMEPKQDQHKSSQDGKIGIACSAAQDLHLSVFQCYSNPALLQECCNSVGNALMSQRSSCHVCIPSSSPACNNRFCRMAFLSKSISSGSELSSEECQPMSQASWFFFVQSKLQIVRVVFQTCR